MRNKTVSGILNLNKPAGLTSHDVVNHVRKLTGIKKIGHTGTLDPLATGVLLVCVGQATRLIEYLMAGTKQYRAAIRLGQTTSTYDAEGEATFQADPSGLTETAIRQALAGFTGDIYQVPPAFSAIKKNGVPLYKLARKGLLVEPEARLVHVERIDLLSFNLPELVVDVTCGPGTYIRSLAHDLGQALGVGAHLTGLTRTANGGWRIEQAVSLETLAQAVANGALADLLGSKEEATAHLPRLILSAEEEAAVKMGRFLPAPADWLEPVTAAYNLAGELVAILIPREPCLLKPKKVLACSD